MGRKPLSECHSRMSPYQRLVTLSASGAAAAVLRGGVDFRQGGGHTRDLQGVEGVGEIGFAFRDAGGVGEDGIALTQSSWRSTRPWKASNGCEWTPTTEAPPERAGRRSDSRDLVPEALIGRNETYAARVKMGGGSNQAPGRLVFGVQQTALRHPSPPLATRRPCRRRHQFCTRG